MSVKIPDDGDAATLSRRLMRQQDRTALATLNAEQRRPYVSLAMVACDFDATPILLLSDLAVHTRNLAADPNVTLLFDGTPGFEPALTGPRVSVVGRLLKTDEPRHRQRYLARHPDAGSYADFDDFSFYRLEMEEAHLVAGFGRIEPVAGSDLCLPIDPVAWQAYETGVVEHMNDDHIDAIELYANVLLKTPGKGWRMTACDPEGCDLRLAQNALRLSFTTVAQSPADVRRELVESVHLARRIQSGESETN